MTLKVVFLQFPISASKRESVLSVEESLTVKQRVESCARDGSPSQGTACLSHPSLYGPSAAWNITISQLHLSFSLSPDAPGQQCLVIGKVMTHVSWDETQHDEITKLGSGPCA